MSQYWRVFALTFVILSVGVFQLYGLWSNEGYQPKQPIAFSHALHAGVMKMECLYCHSSAEKGAHAGIPSVESCMGCHSIVKTNSPEIIKLTEYYNSGKPVPWVRIHRLPDHSYFSHRWHVAAGVACQTCHGPIQNQPVVRQWTKLEMGGCMECHRQSNYVAGIHHPPTFKEIPVTEAEIAQVKQEAAPEQMTKPEWQSARLNFEKYHAGSYSADEAKVIIARLVEYRENRYIHGRPVQVLGQNASVECSTCHY